ncbi:MAG: TonB-dependent receptor [Saprospiraceae bacterium]|nr:TonB-dependent receptor [Saprospiraceae bacterium]
MTRFSLILLFGFLCCLLFGQADTTVNLDSILVLDEPIRGQSIGTRSTVFDLSRPELLPVADISQLAGESGSLFIKSYGFGSLATSSFRGAGASQTLVLWNGLPIQSPMLGQLDLSLLPLEFVDEVIVIHGGSSALWGSGAVAGSIELRNKVTDKNSIKIRSSLGSFNYQDQNLAISFGKRFRGSTSLLYRTTENDFPYQPFTGADRVRQQNAKFVQKGLLQSFTYLFSKNKDLSLHVWLQDTDREIPPLITQNSSQARQNDKASRFSLIYKNIGDHSQQKFKIAFFNEKNIYDDPVIRLSNINEFYTSLLDLEQEWSLKHWFRFSIGTTHSYTLAEAQAYTVAAKVYRASVFVNGEFDLGKAQFMTSLRKQWSELQVVPPVPSLSFEYDVFSQLTLKGKISYDYRLPTLNDLFWTPGGNPDLMPEKGWSEELGIRIENKESRFDWNLEVTAYNRRINNWIIWSPTEKQSFFSPRNLTRVWSRGLEQQISVKYFLPDPNKYIGLNLNSNIQRSTNEIPVAIPKMAEGEQLVYTPKFQITSRIIFNLNKVQCSYQHQFISGYSGINDPLPSYNLGFLNLSGDLTIFKQDLVWFLRLNNLWNKDYQVVERRPMPGRNFRAGINVEIE